MVYRRFAFAALIPPTAVPVILFSAANSRFNRFLLFQESDSISQVLRAPFRSIA